MYKRQVLGVVLGLAAKDTVANFFAGIFLMADSPFKEGDYILLETGERGYVKSMGLRSTRFLTRDDIEITIPNSVIASSKIVNESGGPEDIERVRITLLVAYGSEIDDVKNLLKSIALNNDNVQNEPEPRVRFREFADSGIKLQLLFWIYKPEIRGRTVDAVNTMNLGGGKKKMKNTNRGVVYQRTKAVKKAIITVAAGDVIDLYENI